MSWAGWASPAWLGALGLLAVPIAVHLLSRGRQRRVRVGSVRWLAPAATARARRMRLARRGLLALRCLVLALVAAALAGPRLTFPAGPGARDWVLVAPEVAAERGRLEAANREPYARLDALLAGGAPLRWLAPGAGAGELATPPPAPAADSWSLVQEASRAAPPAVAFEVFALDRAASLRGARPQIDRQVVWHAVVDPAPNRWIERAVPLAGSRLAVFVGESDPAGTRYRRLDVAAGAAARDGELEVAVEDGPEGRRAFVIGGGSLAADDALAVPQREPPGAAILFAAERAADAAYVQAGLEAVRDSGAVALGAVRPLALGAAAAEPSRQDLGGPEPAALVFWLSPDPVPAALRESVTAGGVLVSDQLARSEPCDCVVRPLAGGLPVRFDRRGDPDPPLAAAAALWEDRHGRPLLEAERLGDGAWLRLHSRFHPAWTDLVLSPAFPAWLLELASDASPAASARIAPSDRRAAPDQATPRRAAAGAAAPDAPGAQTGRWLWLGAAALLALERRVAAGTPA